MSAAIICALATMLGYEIRMALPEYDGTEYVRQAHLWGGFVSMAAIDALTIFLLRWHGKCYRRLTNPLTIVLGCSIITHAFGAFAYASANFVALDIYDVGVNVVALAQVLVFCWWLWGRTHGRRDRRYHPRTTSVNLLRRTVTLRHSGDRGGYP